MRYKGVPPKNVIHDIRRFESENAQGLREARAEQARLKEKRELMSKARKQQASIVPLSPRMGDEPQWNMFSAGPAQPI